MNQCSNYYENPNGGAAIRCSNSEEVMISVKGRASSINARICHACAAILLKAFDQVELYPIAHADNAPETFTLLDSQ